LLADCGFTQDTTRTPNKVHFVNTVKIETNRTRLECGPAGCAARKIEINQTASYDFTIDISADTTVSATSGQISVFGDAINIAAVSTTQVKRTYNPTLDPADGDTKVWPGRYNVEFSFITSVQYPYTLAVPQSGFISTPGANFGTSNKYTAVQFLNNGNPGPCAVTANNAACQQTWTLGFKINEDCSNNNLETLNTAAMTFTFNVVCQTNFADACAGPKLSQQPQVTFTLTSPNYCPQPETIDLTPTMELYRGKAGTAGAQSGVTQNDLTNDFAKFSPPTPAATSGTPSGIVNDGLYGEETVFSYQSHLYGEVGALVENDAVTLSSFRIYRITIDNQNDAGDVVDPLIVYSDCNTGSIQTQSCPPQFFSSTTGSNQLITGSECDSSENFPTFARCYVRVSDVWKTSTTAENDHDNSHARFGIQWNQYTLPRTSTQQTQDASIPYKITVESIVEYAEGIQSSPSSPSKVKLMKHIFEASSASPVQSSASTVSRSAVVTSPPDSNFTPPNSESSSSSAGSKSEYWVGGGVGLGLLALSVVAALYLKQRRKAKTIKTEDTTKEDDAINSSPSNVSVAMTELADSTSNSSSSQLILIKEQYDNTSI